MTNKNGLLSIDGALYAVECLGVTSYLGENHIELRMIPGVFSKSNELAKANGRPHIERVIFNDPATIVYWSDKSKTVVKCQPGDTFNEETGLAMCIAKKYFGNAGNYCEVFKKWIPEETKPVDVEIRGFRVGDKVRVVNTGMQYSSYKDWIQRNVTNRIDADKWGRGNGLRPYSIGVVKYLAPHGNGYETIAYVEIGNVCHMIELSGLEKI